MATVCQRITTYSIRILCCGRPKQSKGSNTQELSERRPGFIRALGVGGAADSIERNPVATVCAVLVCTGCYKHLPIPIPERRSTQFVNLPSPFAICQRKLLHGVEFHDCLKSLLRYPHRARGGSSNVSIDTAIRYKARPHFLKLDVSSSGRFVQWSPTADAKSVDVCTGSNEDLHPVALRVDNRAKARF